MITHAGGSHPFGDYPAEASLDEALLDIFQAVPTVTQAGLLLLDRQWIITNINDEAQHMLRSWLPDLVGRDFWEVVPEQIADQHLETTRLGLTYSLQHHFIAHDEFEGRWSEYTFILNPAGYSVSLRDAGAAKDMERLLWESERRNDLIFDVNENHT